MTAPREIVEGANAAAEFRKRRDARIDHRDADTSSGQQHVRGDPERSAQRGACGGRNAAWPAPRPVRQSRRNRHRPDRRRSRGCPCAKIRRSAPRSTRARYLMSDCVRRNTSLTEAPSPCRRRMITRVRCPPLPARPASAASSLCEGDCFAAEGCPDATATAIATSIHTRTRLRYQNRHAVTKATREPTARLMAHAQSGARASRTTSRRSSRDGCDRSVIG